MIPENVKVGLKEGKLFVYDSDIVGWIECEIKRENKAVKMLKHNIVSRAHVKTSDGTLLSRFLKEITNVDSIVQDGSVYKLVQR